MDWPLAPESNILPHGNHRTGLSKQQRLGGMCLERDQICKVVSLEAYHLLN